MKSLKQYLINEGNYPGASIKAGDTIYIKDVDSSKVYEIEVENVKLVDKEDGANQNKVTLKSNPLKIEYFNVYIDGPENVYSAFAKIENTSIRSPKEILFATSKDELQEVLNSKYGSEIEKITKEISKQEEQLNKLREQLDKLLKQSTIE